MYVGHVQSDSILRDLMLDSDTLQQLISKTLENFIPDGPWWSSGKQSNVPVKISLVFAYINIWSQNHCKLYILILLQLFKKIYVIKVHNSSKNQSMGKVVEVQELVYLHQDRQQDQHDCSTPHLFCLPWLLIEACGRRTGRRSLAYWWKNHRRSSRVAENNSFCALVLCFNWLICHSKKQKPTISKPLLSSQYPLPASSWHLPKGHERGRPLTSAKLLKLLNCCKSAAVRVEIPPHTQQFYLPKFNVNPTFKKNCTQRKTIVWRFLCSWSSSPWKLSTQCGKLWKHAYELFLSMFHLQRW